MPVTTVADLPMSTYMVIPFLDQNGVLRCTYLDASYQPVRSDQLDCHAQGFKVDFLCIRPVQADLPTALRRDADAVDSLVLFAAVAKTLNGSGTMQNMVLADEFQRIVLPVMPGTRRGVILVFKRMAADGACGLIASTDPEIKNSTFG
jgi:hypothetical protein